MADSAKRILVVDDSSTMRRILRATLNRIGYMDITEAGNGVEAYAKASEQVFDCVLTDWNMPEMDGLELTVKLRAKPEYKGVPIVMVTTEGGKQDVLEALTKGTTSYIVKPFTPEILKQKMDELFNR
jgi:two-component system chemotaxis response regulator CheY